MVGSSSRLGQSSGRKAKRRIPIPSFSSLGSPEKPRDEEESAGETKTALVSHVNGRNQTLQQSPSAVHRDAISRHAWFDAKRLVRADAALQVLFRTSSRPKIPLKESLVPIGEFWSVVPKLDVRRSTDVEASSNASKQEQHVETPVSLRILSTGEHILHDLVYVASPLYQLVRKSDKSDLCLQFVPFSGNRKEELQRCIARTKDFDSSKSSTIIMKIRGACSGSTTTPGDAVKTNNENSSQPSDKKEKRVFLEPFIRADMSLEERVRAREKAKQDRKASSVSIASTTSSTVLDQAVLLRFADALWCLARQIQSRQEQQWKRSGQNGPPPSRPVRCGVPMQEILEVTSKSLAVRGSGSSRLLFATSHKEKASRKQIFQALRELLRIVPEWISISEEKFTKHTTVWITTGATTADCNAFVEYSAMRTAKLGALPPSRDNAAPKRPLVSVFPSQAPPKKLSVERRLHKKANTSLVPLPNESGPVTKKLRASPPLSTTDTPQTTILYRRPAVENPETAAPPAKKRRRLRINKNLIMTDADYDGGMVIKPSLEDSPRGLKRLFTQLNSGHRI